jgi:hypothetical protein
MLPEVVAWTIEVSTDWEGLLGADVATMGHKLVSVDEKNIINFKRIIISYMLIE